MLVSTRPAGSDQKRLALGLFRTAPGHFLDGDRLEALRVGFLHVHVQEAFDQLEEYMPEFHRLQRRRYTIDVIRGPLG